MRRDANPNRAFRKNVRGARRCDRLNFRLERRGRRSTYVGAILKPFKLSLVNVKTMIQRLVPSKLLALICAMSVSVLAFADDLARLEGKWTSKRKASNGDEVTQVVEIKGSKFTFNLKGADGELRLYAEGELKTDKLGPFSIVKFFNIKGGQSSTDLQAVDDDRVNVYVLDFDKLKLASGFDKDRDGDEPRVDVYTKSLAK